MLESVKSKKGKNISRSKAETNDYLKDVMNYPSSNFVRQKFSKKLSTNTFKYDRKKKYEGKKERRKKRKKEPS